MLVISTWTRSVDDWAGACVAAWVGVYSSVVTTVTTAGSSSDDVVAPEPEPRVDSGESPARRASAESWR